VVAAAPSGPATEAEAVPGASGVERRGATRRAGSPRRAPLSQQLEPLRQRRHGCCPAFLCHLQSQVSTVIWIGFDPCVSFFLDGVCVEIVRASPLKKRQKVDFFISNHPKKKVDFRVPFFVFCKF
jgi:hypothetical protein